MAEFIESHCVIPDGDHQGDPYLLTDEMLRFCLWHYRLDDVGRFLYRRSQLVRPQKWGKALALGTPVPVPSGWATMESLRVGDVVFDERGDTCMVVGKSPVWHDTDCYRVTFSDGAAFVASGEHLWAVEERSSSGHYVARVLPTTALAGRLVDQYGARRYRVRSSLPLQLAESDLPVDPYVLGAWLGDGERGDGRVVCPDRAVVEEIEAAGYRVRQTDAIRWRVYGLKADLRRAGVLGAKHIPEMYLRASEKQRWALLQGLMDTDGHCEKRGRLEFSTTAPALRDGVRELLYSLGLKHLCLAGDARLYGRVTGPKWRIQFSARSDMPVFRLGRKADRMLAPGRSHAQYQHRRIVAVEAVAGEPTVCVAVDSPSRCFLVGREMIPTHNSPFAAALICAEAEGPVLFDGWDANGEPVGRPWSTPWIQVTAVSEDQTDNVWRALVPMITLGALKALIPDTGETRINLRGGGRIEPVTSSARSRLGQRVTFCVQDETHAWLRENGGVKLADTQRRNVAGMDGRLVETTNAWDPAEESVAQQTAAYSGTDVHRDHVVAPAGSIRNRRELRRCLKAVYGDSWWVNLERIEAEVTELAERDPAQAERFFLNRVVAGSGQAFDPDLWAAAARPGYQAADGALVTVGFAGSRYDDATAIVATEVESGYQWPVGVWEKPVGAEGWEVPEAEVTEALEALFDRYDVWRLYANPSYWEATVDGWSGRWGDKRIVKWWTNRTKPMAYALRAYHGAMVAGDLTHSGDPVMARHVVNARRRSHPGIRDDQGRPMWTVSKDRAGSALRIDALIAGCLSWEARGDAVASGALAAPAVAVSKYETASLIVL